MSAIIVAIFVASGTGADVDSIVTAARSALESGTVLAGTGADSDEGAIDAARKLGAAAVVRVSFRDGVAYIRVHVEGPSAWDEDAIRFGETDDIPERGRTVGYAVAAMVTRLEVARDTGPTPPPSRLPLPPRPPAPRSEVDLTFTGNLTVDGTAWGLGPNIGGRWWGWDAWGLGARAFARFGGTPAADASLTTYGVTVGPSFRRDLGPLELGAHAGVGLLHYVLTRTTSGTEGARTRWLGAVDVTLEGALRLHGGLALLIGSGVEVGWGTTPIRVSSVEVAELPAFRWVSTIGGRYRF